jgi:hypothetical protein
MTIEFDLIDKTDQRFPQKMVRAAGFEPAKRNRP